MTARESRDSAVVAIPVKNEVHHIGACLRAVAGQNEIHASQILLLLNDCSDGTDEVVRAVAPTLDVPVRTIVQSFPAALASAGYARHVVMERAAATMSGGVLLTTDADGRVAPDWIAVNLRALGAGVDAVVGRAIIDPIDAMLIPQRLHDDDALECAYGDLLDEIAALLDPEPWDPWPRHWEHSGASMAVTWEAYCRAGGLPAMPLGEDRAFFRALQRIDARVRHAPEARVTVSGRILGRAAGGMADTIRRRLEAPDAWLDDRLELPEDAVRRARLRRILRGMWAGDSTASAAPACRIAAALGIHVEQLYASMTSRFFGEFWKEIETISAKLVRRPVPATSVTRAIARATTIRDRLRGASAVSRRPTEDPGDSVCADVAALA